MRKNINLQLFADGDNGNSPVRIYSKQFMGLMAAVFNVQAHFRDLFAGDLETIDGISETATAFSVKTSDIASAITTGTVSAAGAYTNGYDKGANVAFGTGTGKSSRFGNRTEIIYKDIDVPYSWNWTFHEGIDRHTVNNDFDGTIAERLDKQAQAKVSIMNGIHGAYISSVAKKTINAAGISDTTAKAIFNEASKYFVNANAVGTKVAKVCPDLWNAIIDNGLATTAKGSTVNIDQNEVKMFKGFVLEQIPDSDFAETTVTTTTPGEGGADPTTTSNDYPDIAYFYVQHIGKAYLGISTSRTIESEDFDGVALQGAGKGGQWVSNDNQKAIAKAINVGA